jgi:hypothetical protein
MSKSSAFKAACLGASLVTAWSASRAEGNADFRITASGNLTSIGGFAQLTFISGDFAVSIPNLADGTTALKVAGTNNPLAWAGTLALNMPDNFASQPWELMGVGTGAQSGDVFVTFADPSHALNQPFSTVFPGTDEAALASAITKRDSVADNKFLLSISSIAGQTPGTPATAVLFSDGVNIGTITVSVTEVPEPSSFALIAMSLAGMCRRVWRRR